MKHDPVVVNSSTVSGALAAAAVLVLSASTLAGMLAYATGDHHLYGLMELLSVDSERNVPTAFSVLLLFLVCSITALISFLHWCRGRPYALHWSALASGLLLMAFDESWEFHEQLSEPMQVLLADGPLDSLYYPWVIAGIGFAAIAGAFFRRFLLDLPSKARSSLLTAAAVYLAGAVGMELIVGLIHGSYGRRNFIYGLGVTIEEGLEMAGLILYLHAALNYVANEFREVRFRFTGGRPTY